MSGESWHDYQQHLQYRNTQCTEMLRHWWNNYCVCKDPSFWIAIVSWTKHHCHNQTVANVLSLLQRHSCKKRNHRVQAKNDQAYCSISLLLFTLWGFYMSSWFSCLKTNSVICPFVVLYRLIECISVHSMDYSKRYMKKCGKCTIIHSYFFI